MATKISIEEIHDYIKLWYDSERWTDFNMAFDSGYTELACKMLQDAGAIDSNMCYDEAKPTEKAIERLLKKYTKKQHKKDLKAVFDNAEVYVNPNSNEHAFIKNGEVNYLLDESEMREMGYIPSKEYYEKY